MITIKLPMPPSVNALYRNVPGKGRVKTHRYLTWIQAAGWAIKEQKPAKVEGPYALWLYCNKPDEPPRDRRIRDLWASGLTLTQIGMRVGASSFTVHRAGKRMGLPSRVVLSAANVGGGRS